MPRFRSGPRKMGLRKQYHSLGSHPPLKVVDFPEAFRGKPQELQREKKNERKNYSTADIQELTVDLPRVGPTCQQKWDSPIFFDRNETRGWKITMMPARHCHREVGSRFSLYKSISINSLWKIVGLSLWVFFLVFFWLSEKGSGKVVGTFFRACVLHSRRIGFH